MGGVDEPSCQHTRLRIALIATKCTDCGQTFQYRPEGETSFQAICLHVLMGKVRAVDVPEDLVTPEQRAVLLSIAPCQHVRRRVVKCCSDAEKEECITCGRRFADRSQWLLDHESSTNPTSSEG